MAGRHEWTPEELAIIRTTPAKWARKSKLTPEQVIEIRRRVDSISVPWSLRDIARDYGLTVAQVVNIARRRDWAELAHEPDNAPWWWEEQRQMRLRRLRDQTP